MVTWVPNIIRYPSLELEHDTPFLVPAAWHRRTPCILPFSFTGRFIHLRTDRGFLHPFSCRFHSSLMVAPPSSTQDLRDAEVLPAQGCHSPARQRPGEEKVRSSSMHRRFPLARRKELLEQVPSRRRSLAYLPHDGIRSRDKSAEPGKDPALHELRVEGHHYPSDVKCV